MFGAAERRKGEGTGFRRKEIANEGMVMMDKDEMEDTHRRLEGTHQIEFPMRRVKNGERRWRRPLRERRPRK
jgi:hypothetical protein